MKPQTCPFCGEVVNEITNDPGDTDIVSTYDADDNRSMGTIIQAYSCGVVGHLFYAPVD